MKKHLLDVNVWLALASPWRDFHEQAALWFDSLHTREACFCRVTQMAFLRLNCNPQAVIGTPLTASESWQLYRTLHSDERVHYEIEPASLENRWQSLLGDRTSGSAWTDAYLAAFAIEGGYRLVTFDRGFTRFPGLAVKVLGPTGQ